MVMTWTSIEGLKGRGDEEAVVVVVAEGVWKVEDMGDAEVVVVVVVEVVFVEAEGG